MAEVGVLNLQIHDNSAKAAEGLNSLATALERVRDVVGQVTGLGNVAKQIEKIYKAVNGQDSGSKSNGLEKMATAMERVQHSVGDAEGKFREVSSRMVEMEQGAEKLAGKMGEVDEAVTKFGKWQFGDAEEKFKKMFEYLNAMRMSRSLGGAGYTERGWTQPVQVPYKISDELIGEKRTWNPESRAWESSGYTQEDLAARMQEAADAATYMQEAMSENNAETERTESIVDRVKDAMGEFGEIVKDIAWMVDEGNLGEDLSNWLSGLTRPLGNLMKQLGRVAKMRMLRAVVKEVAAGLKEGVQNVYEYSKAVGGYFAPAMDSAASSLLLMKNSIGAAAAPVISALIPYLQTAVNWFVTLINYVNQFLALLTGKSSWTKAIETQTDAFKNASKGAKGADKNIKELLADWDELNIIQSESGGGSGGGGGGSSTDYKNMFEEVSQFDETLKRSMAFIEEHMGGIKQLAIDIGALVLGWMISSKFSGLLGKIGSLLVGYHALKLGIELSYGSGFEAGKKGGFDGQDLLGAIGGAIASAVGGYFLLGPAGIVIGLGVSAIVTLTGYIQGERDAADALRWGSTSLTPEEIEEYVKKSFTFNIEARINTLDAVIEDESAKRNLLNESISNFSASLDKISLGVDNSPAAVADAADKAKAVIDMVNDEIKVSQKTIQVLTKINPITDANGTDITSSFLSDLNSADSQLTQYFNGLGQQIANLIDRGQKTQWANNEAEMALELMQHEQNIVDQANRNKINRDFQVDSEMGLAGMTRENAQETFERQKALIDEYKQKTETAYAEAIKDLYWRADLADAAGLKDAKGNPLSQAYLNQAKALEEQVKNGDIYNELNESVKLIKSKWAEALKNIYGERLGESADLDMTFSYLWNDWFYGGMTEFEKNISNKYSKFGVDTAVEAIKSYFDGSLESADPSGIMRGVMDEFGMTIFDLADQEVKNSLAEHVGKATGDKEATRLILQGLGITGEALTTALRSAFDDDEGIAKATRDAILDSMFDNKWNELGPEEFRKLVEQLKSEFGDYAVNDALSELDIPPADLEVPVGDVNLVQDEVEVSTEDAKLQTNVDMEVFENAAMAEGSTTVSDVATEDVNQAKTVLESMSAVEAGAPNMTWFNSVLSGMVSRAWAAADSIREAMSSIGINVGGGSGSHGFMVNTNSSGSGGSHGFASGGFPRSGDLVMANENGQFEMMGQMGHQPVIANNQQIVEGISRGVSQSNSGMESRLSNIETLLNRIAGKEFTAKVVPSSSLGRNNRQSELAYSRVSG